MSIANKYLLLTEFEVCTVSYGPSFFPFRFMAQARIRIEKTRLARYLLYLYSMYNGIGNDLRLQSSEAGRKQNESISSEIVFKSFTRFSRQLRVKESFKLLFAS